MNRTPLEFRCCFAARLTGVGRGAVATVAVAGSEALAALQGCFFPAADRSLAAAAVDEFVFGRWGSASAGEEVLIARREHGYEVHCHGGEMSVAAILEDLAECSCDLISAAEFLARQQIDPLEISARQALARCATSAAAAVLLDQLHGALGKSIKNIRSLLEQGSLEKAIPAVKDLLEVAPCGLHLVQPWRVVLAGLPNAGKSSLINALLGYERAITADQPGTTRDVVTAHTVIGGRAVELSDTAGIRTAGDALEAAGVTLTKQRIEQADLVIWVSEAVPLLGNLPEEATTARAGIQVASKCDLLSPGQLEELSVSHPDMIQTSATTLAGIQELLNKIAESLAPFPPPGTAVPFTPQQVDCLQQLLAALERGDAGVETMLDKFS